MNNELSNSQTLVFLEILQILRDEKNILTRKKIYEFYIDEKLNNKISLNLEKRTFVEKLNGTFDEIGFLVEEFNLQESLFSYFYLRIYFKFLRSVNPGSCRLFESLYFFAFIANCVK